MALCTQHISTSVLLQNPGADSFSGWNSELNFFYSRLGECPCVATRKKFINKHISDRDNYECLNIYTWYAINEILSRDEIRLLE